MTQALFRYLVPTLLCLTVLAAPVYAKELVTWVTPDTSPYNIVRGKDKGTGYSDMLRKFFQQRLTDYDHNTSIMTISRYLLGAKQGKTLCMCDLLKTPEREELLCFSDPIVLTPSLRVYTLPGGTINPGGTTTVSVKELLADPQLRTALMQERSYGPVLDPLIATYKSRPNVMVTQFQPERIHQLLLEGRIDYLIEYPFSIPANQKKLNSTRELTPLKISEQADYAVAYLTCSDTPEGQAIIQDVNTLIKKHKGSPEFKKVFMLPSHDMGAGDKQGYEELWQIFQTIGQ